MNCFLLTAIRSGSTYLIDLLDSTGMFAYPAAHSDHPSLLPQRDIREFFAPSPTDPWSEGERTREKCLAHLRHKLSFMRASPNLFKVLMEQYTYYLMTGEDRMLVESMVPDLKYIWLERRDLVARTVSAYLFFRTKVAHIATAKDYNDYMSTAVDLDEKGLLEVYSDHVKGCNWSTFLNGAPFLKVEYEDLVAHPEQILRRCLGHLGLDHSNLDLAGIAAAHPRFRTERPESPVWMSRLRHLLKKRVL